jgi:hypothetical protein
MEKFCSSLVLGAACTYIRDNVVKVAVCASLTTNTVANVQSNMLAETALTTGASTSWTIADSSVSGRKITMTAQSSIAIATTGTAKNIALYSSVSGQVYYVTNCTTQALVSTNNKVTIPAFSMHFYDAT